MQVSIMSDNRRVPPPQRSAGGDRRHHARGEQPKASASKTPVRTAAAGRRAPQRYLSVAPAPRTSGPCVARTTSLRDVLLGRAGATATPEPTRSSSRSAAVDGFGRVIVSDTVQAAVL
jgi:hypothetical protein